MCTHTQGGHASQGGGGAIRILWTPVKFVPNTVQPSPDSKSTHKKYIQIQVLQWLVYISKHKLNAVKYQVLHTLVNLTTFVIYIEKYQICSNPIFKLIILPEPKLKTSVADPE